MNTANEKPIKGRLVRLFYAEGWKTKGAYRFPENSGTGRQGFRRFLFLSAWAELHKKHSPLSMPRRVRRAICRDIATRQWREFSKQRHEQAKNEAPA